MIKKINSLLLRLSIKKKILYLITIFNLLTIVIYTFIKYTDEKELMLKAIDGKLETATYAVVNALGNDFHDRINGAGSLSEEDHMANIKKLNVISNDLGFSYVYTMVEDKRKIYFTSSSATEEELKDGSFSPFFQEYTEASGSILLTAQDGKTRFEESTDRWGTFRSIMKSFKSQGGKKYVVGVDVEASDVHALIGKVLMESLLVGSIIFIGSFLIFVIVASRITKPISYLAKAAEKISGGDLNLDIDIDTNDETRKLADAFQSMLRNIKNYIETLAEEKAGVERKIEAAISESEHQKKYLAESVDKILEAMNKLSEGDLTVKLEKENDDVIGKLCDQFNLTVSNISFIINNVQNVIQSTADASVQIAASTGQMKAGSVNQVNEISRIADSIREVTEIFSDNSKKALEAATKANQAGDKAKAGGVVVQDTIAMINKIANIAQKSAQTVEELGKSSSQIGEIVEVITDIADQTNLLALNAAIEAARAGEQGRGFAVVADEVRKLAERTTKATKEIENMIKTIQVNTVEAVDVIRNGEIEIDNGKRLSATAGNALNEIIYEVQNVSEIISHVASASERQSSKSYEINSNIDLITSITEQSSIGVDQIVEAANHLSNLTLELKDKIERFRVEEYEYR